MKPQYERTSWGWLASLVHGGYRYFGRGGTKREARTALRRALA